MSDSPKIFPQYITVICANLGVFGVGSILGYASPASLILTSNNNTDITLTGIQNGWFSSCSNLGAFIGCSLAGVCLNNLGRRGTIIFSFLPALTGWILIVLSQNFPMLLVGRLITGLYCSFITTSVPTYVGEISSPHIRGALGIIFQFMFTSGILFAVSMGALFNSFRIIGALCAICPCVCSFLMLFSKESPMYLLSKDKEKKAVEALLYFRGKDYNGISTEIKSFKTTLEEKKKRKSKLSDLTQFRHLRPLLMCLCLFFFQESSGVDGVIFNLALIFKKVNYSISETTSSIIYCSVQYFGILIGFFLIDSIGRKLILAISSLMMAISLALLGTYFYFLNENPNYANQFGWLPLVALTTYITSYSSGIGPVPWLMLGELFSPEVKELSASIVTTSNWFFAFVVALLFYPLQNVLNDYGLYFMYCGFCVLSFIFSLTFVYETKGKTLQEINNHFAYYKLNE